MAICASCGLLHPLRAPCVLLHAAFGHVPRVPRGRLPSCIHESSSLMHCLVALIAPSVSVACVPAPGMLPCPSSHCLPAAGAHLPPLLPSAPSVSWIPPPADLLPAGCIGYAGMVVCFATQNNMQADPVGTLAIKQTREESGVAEGMGSTRSQIRMEVTGGSLAAAVKQQQFPPASHWHLWKIHWSTQLQYRPRQQLHPRLG